MIPPFDPKTSDGCSGGVRQVARHLCVAHDKEYWYGTTWKDKWIADWNLCKGYWIEGWNRVTSHDQPILALPGWWLMGIIRGIGVLLLGNRAFWNKPHK